MSRPPADQELWQLHGPSGKQAPAVSLIPVPGGHPVSLTEAQWATLQAAIVGVANSAASAPVQQTMMQILSLLTTAQGNSIATTTQAVGVTTGQIHQDLIAIVGVLEEIRDGINALPGLLSGSPTPAPTPTPGPTPTPTPVFTPVTMNNGNTFFSSNSAVGFANQPFVPVPTGAKTIKLSVYSNQVDALVRVAVQYRRVVGSTAPGDQSYYGTDLTTDIITATAGEFAANTYEVPVDGPEVRISLQSVTGGATAKLYAGAY